MKHYLTASLGRGAFLARALVSLAVAVIAFVVVLALVSFVAGATGNAGSRGLAYLMALVSGIATATALLSGAIAGRFRDLRVSTWWTLAFWAVLVPFVLPKRTADALIIGMGTPGFMILLTMIAILASVPSRHATKPDCS